MLIYTPKQEWQRLKPDTRFQVILTLSVLSFLVEEASEGRQRDFPQLPPGGLGMLKQMFFWGKEVGF